MKSKSLRPFNVQGFLDSAGIAKTIVEYPRGEVIFTQGDPCEHVLYVRSGGVKLSVLSRSGREAVVAIVGPGDFFGEGCLAGQPLRMGSATAIAPSTVLLVDKARMIRLLHSQHAMSDRFIAHMLARYGKADGPAKVMPKISQETLGEMVGTTRSRVNFFLNKFRKLGFIQYDGERPLKVNDSLLSVVLHD